MGNKQKNEWGTLQIFLHVATPMIGVEKRIDMVDLPQFSIGEEISGYVQLQLKKKFPGESIQIQLFEREDLYFHAKGIKGDIHTENYYQKEILTITNFPEEMPLLIHDYPFKFKVPQNFQPSFFHGWGKAKSILGHYLFAQLIPRDKNLMSAKGESILNGFK